MSTRKKQSSLKIRPRPVMMIIRLSTVSKYVLHDLLKQNCCEANIVQRYINLTSVAFFGLLILCSWQTFACSFQFALLNGGPASMFYGGLLACIGESAVAFSLAELASM
jgi:hypothetical protein